MNKEKISEERIFEIVHCPFEGRAKLHHLCQLNGQVGRSKLGGNSKGQCTISKIIFPLVLTTFIEQNIFFPETYNAFTISKPDFTVWNQFKYICHTMARKLISFTLVLSIVLTTSWLVSAWKCFQCAEDYYLCSETKDELGNWKWKIVGCHRNCFIEEVGCKYE